MAALLIVNPHSGDGSTFGTVVDEARERGIGVHVLRQGEHAGELARQAAGDVLGIAGGDGSLASVAAVCVERELPLVVVPLGTRNHFARDLGLDPSDPVAALAAFADGVERQVDVGRANGRLFLNNVSLGEYARLVHRRERNRRRREVLARLRALGTVLRRPQPIGITIDGRPVRARVVLVANNAYELDMLSLGARKRLDEGLLHVYVPSGLLRRSWRERAAQQVVLDARGGRLRAAIDGEPEQLETPIEFRIEPATLRLLLPRGPAP
jgi:diacylglycerol kinase family enzyme